MPLRVQAAVAFGPDKPTYIKQEACDPAAKSNANADATVAAIAVATRAAGHVAGARYVRLRGRAGVRSPGRRSPPRV